MDDNQAKAVKQQTSLEIVCQHLAEILNNARQTEERAYHLNRKMSGDSENEEGDQGKESDPSTMAHIERISWFTERIDRSQKNTFDFFNKLEESI